MKSCALFVILALSPVCAVGDAGNPIAKVVGMVSRLQQEVVGEGVEAQKMYSEFAEMCEDRSRDLHNEIKTGKATAAELTATIEKATADTAVSEEKISDFASAITEDESDLKKATTIRAKENTNFKAVQKELLTSISTIERATRIIEKETKGGASLAQVANMQSVTQALSAMVDAQGMNYADGSQLTALIQSSSNSDSDEDSAETGATSAKNQGGSIVDTLEGLLEKSQGELDDARKEETAAANAYQMQKQSLDAKVKFANKEMSDAKKSKAATAEEKASAAGALDVTKKDVAADIQDLAELHHECLTEATNFEDATKSRGEELKALAAAKKIIVESTGGASSQTYLVDTSFLQVSTKNADSSRAVNMVRHLAMSLRSRVLVQLADRLQSVSHSRSRDPFGKVKSMIKSMVEKLLDEADSEATKKAYCDKEMSETGQKQEEKEDDVEKLTTQIDVSSAASKKLKGEVGALQKELAALSRTQAEMDKLRQEEKAVFNQNQLEQGIKGVKTALKVLREYYAQDDKSHDSADGAGAGIIGLLEVCESDFSKGLAEMVASEEASANEYEKATNENNVVKAAKGQDAKYKTKEHVGLDKSIVELKTDKSGVSDELAAVNEYFAGIKKECIAKAEPYEEKVKRRTAEIAGLKDALSTLASDDASLLQRSSVHRHLRASK